MVEGKRPRVAAKHRRALYSGIDFVEADDDDRPLIIGERTNEVGSRKFKRLISDEKYEEASEIARQQVKGGAQIIDVNLQNADRDELHDIDRFYELLGQEGARADHDRHDRSGRDRALADVLPGQVDHQLDQPRGRAREVRARDAARAHVRRGARRRLHRRGQGAGAGDHARAQAARSRSARGSC